LIAGCAKFVLESELNVDLYFSVKRSHYKRSPTNDLTTNDPTTNPAPRNALPLSYVTGICSNCSIV